jgi:glycosyltransferase involved in cell wall biosynthesis
LDQTFANFELIVVNDASPDDTTMVIHAFEDARIKYIIHSENKGLPATRNTGIRASTGRYIAFLDHDDVFHPQKLDSHMRYLQEHPEIGMTYNSRFEVARSVRDIRRLWIAPKRVELADLVLGYPFSPSDLVIRRDCLLDIGLLDEGNLFHGEDLNTNCRLALAGYRFASIDRALNYRRNHPARSRKNLDASLRNVFRNLELIFDDPRCPPDVRLFRDLAYANNYLIWSYLALAQQESELGREYLRKAIQLDASLSQDDGRKLLDFLIQYCVDDERGELDEALAVLFQQLPVELAAIQAQFNWALGRAYLLKGIQDVIWMRAQAGEVNFGRAVALKASTDDALLGQVTHQLLGYRNEFGHESTMQVLARLSAQLQRLSHSRPKTLTGSYLINSAFEEYRAGRYRRVPGLVIRALIHDSSYMKNRGVISILVRSMVADSS